VVGGAWPFSVGGVICLLDCDNERDFHLLVLARRDMFLYFYLCVWWFRLPLICRNIKLSFRSVFCRETAALN